MTTTTKPMHTPGPWYYEPGNGIFDSTHIQIASTSYTDKPVSMALTNNEAEGNARLISKAPELLAMVRRIAEDDGQTAASLVVAARLLLADIEGR